MIIANNTGGLSNRLKAFASSVRLGKQMERPVGIKWDILDNYKTHNHILNCPFSKLFTNDIEVDHIRSNDVTLDDRVSHCLVIYETDNIPHNFNDFNSRCAKQFTKADKYNRNIDFMYNKIPDSLRQEYIKYFSILKPIKEISDNIDIFSKLFDSNTISVHIRSWNRNAEGSRRKSLFNIELFEAEMMKYPDSNFFIATDSQAVRDYFIGHKEFSNRIHIYPRLTPLDNSRDHYKGIQEDLIELYLLSKNSHIIGSHFSTYTEVAWWLGGCCDKITII